MVWTLFTLIKITENQLSSMNRVYRQIEPKVNELTLFQRRGLIMFGVTPMAMFAVTHGCHFAFNEHKMETKSSIKCIKSVSYV